METYCVSCRKNTANKNASARKPKQNRSALSSSCAVCGKKRSRYIKNQETRRLEIR